MKKKQIDIGRLRELRNLYRHPYVNLSDGAPLPGARHEVRNAGHGISELYLYGEICSDDITASEVAAALGKATGSMLRVRINSCGGDIFDGVAIYNLLALQEKRVEVWIDSIAASIASVIAMAGDEICIAENASMMIHRAWGVCYGDVDDISAFATLLAHLEDAQLIPTYQAKTGISRDKIFAMMKDETWMGADDAISNKFADRKLSKSDAKAMVRPGAFARMPARVRESAGLLNRAGERDRLRARLRDRSLDPRTRDAVMRVLIATVD